MGRFTAIHKIYKHIKDKQKLLIRFWICFTVMEVLYTMLSVALPKVMVDALYFNEKRIDIFLELLFFFLLTLCILGWIKTMVLNKSNAKVTRIKNHYAMLLYNKILNLKYEYIEDPNFLNANNFTFAVVEEYDRGIEGVCHILFRLPANIILCLLLIGILGGLSPVIVIALIWDWYFKIRISKKFSNTMYAKKKEIGEYKRKMNYFYKISHDFSFGKDIRIFRLHKLIKNDYLAEIEKYIKSLKKLYGTLLKSENINAIFSVLCDSIVIVVLIYNIYKGMSISYFTMYLAAINMLKEYMKNTNMDINTLFCEMPYIYDFFELIEKNENKEPEKKILENNNNEFDITFENVSFQYPKTQKKVLNHVDFEIKRGDKIALVGVNGSGKTTLIKLLLRLYTPTEGCIKINGININEINIESLYMCYSPIFQDICIYPFTILENISCSDDEPEVSHLKRCLKNADLDEAIENLPNGLQSKLFKNFYSDGIDLSGGEKQKISIARALYKNSPIAIFDEPTASLDPIAEEKLYTGLNDLLNNKTVIFISHRLTSIRFCNKIILFSEGKLIESGTFKKLIEKKGEFYKMYKKQGMYYEK